MKYFINSAYLLFVALMLPTNSKALSNNSEEIHESKMDINIPEFSAFFGESPILEDCFEYNKTGKPIQMIVLPRRGSPYASNNCNAYENLMKLKVKDISSEVKSVLIIYPGNEDGEKRFRHLHFDESGKLSATEEGIGGNISGKHTTWHNGTICTKEEQICSGNPFFGSYTWIPSGFSFRKDIATGIERVATYKYGLASGRVLYIAKKDIQVDKETLIKPMQIVAGEFYAEGNLLNATYLKGTKHESNVSSGEGLITLITSSSESSALYSMSDLISKTFPESLFLEKISVKDGKKNGAFTILDINKENNIVVSGSYTSDELLLSNYFSKEGEKNAIIEWNDNNSPVCVTYLWESGTPKVINKLVKIETSNNEQSISTEKQTFNRCGVQTSIIIRDAYGKVKQATYRDEFGNVINTIDNYCGEERDIDKNTGEIVATKK